VPHRLDGGAQLAERLRIGRIEPPRATAPLGDQPGLLQHLQVLGNGGTADRQTFGNGRDGPRRAEDALENQPSRGRRPGVRKKLLQSHIELVAKDEPALWCDRDCAGAVVASYPALPKAVRA